jgi:hypothetical protein
MLTRCAHAFGELAIDHVGQAIDDAVLGATTRRSVSLTSKIGWRCDASPFLLNSSVTGTALGSEGLVGFT